MSGLIVGLVLRTPITKVFNSEAKFVAAVYADHAWEDGTHAYPAVATVASITGYAERTVQRYVHALVKIGMLIPDGQGPRGTNRYSFPLEAGKDGSVRLAYSGGDTVTPPASVEKPADSGDSQTPRQADGGDRDSGDRDSGDSLTPEQLTRQSLVVVVNAGDIAKKYEQEFGGLTPMIADMIQDDCKTYPVDWIPEAMQIAVEANKRDWRYVRGILKRCAEKNMRPSLNKLEKPNGNTRPNQKGKPASASHTTRRAGSKPENSRPGDDGPEHQPADDPQAAQRHRERWQRLRQRAKVPAV